MARPSSPPILAQIRNSRSSAEQIVALRALKNEIIGHQQKKEMWVGLGVVDPIVRIITSNKAQGKQNSKEGYDDCISSESLSEKEMVRLQALCVVGSLAHGGPAFLAPLHSALVVPAILSNLCPTANPSQLVLSALRALCNLADSVCLASNTSTLNANTLADSVFSRPYIGALCNILSQSSSSSSIQSQIVQTTSIVSKLCRTERHQLILARHGVLEALSTRLAAIVVSQGLVIPGADLVAQKEGLSEYFPPPAPRNADLAGVLEAIATIIADSKFRASQLVYSNAIMAVFPNSTLTEFQANHSTKAAWGAFNAADLGARQSRLSAMEYLIPYIHSNRSKGASTLTSTFPPLGTPSSHEHLVQFGGAKLPTWSRSPNFGTTSPTEITPPETLEPESPLIPYLIWLTRSAKDMDRLMAGYVLAVLYRAGLMGKSREVTLGLLVVPVLIQLLRNEKIRLQSVSYVAASNTGGVTLEWKIKERALAILAMLIVDSEYLQKSAYDAGIVGRLSEILKAAYEPVLEGSQSRTWSPSNDANCEPNISGPSQSWHLGQGGLSPLLVHKINMRECTLRAIAALVPFKDDYRKALIDQGVVPYVVQSLKPNPDKPTNQTGENPEKLDQLVDENKARPFVFGVNPVSVLIAACGAVRHLSRSVSILRTTLIDNGVVMPVFSLLRHPDIDVQISATAAACNLVMDFSPMRETITKAGVLKILCEHAHSGNVKLRLNAVWALKHLIQSAGNDVKKACLEELGQGWLVQLICDDTEDEALCSDQSRLRSFAVHEDTDYLPVDRFEEEDDSRMEVGPGVLCQSYSSTGTKPFAVGSRPTSSRGESSLLANARLAALRDLEMNPARRARKDDIAVQEQGLDFIRNLIGGYNNVGTTETSEMIDFLLNALGQDHLFEILASKLRFKVINQFNKRGSAGNNETRLVPPQAEIIAAVGFILVNMAASAPRHRQLVIAQTELLKLLVPHFSHPNKEVRIAICWLAINLTWVDDANEGHACAQRALELKKLGFLAKLENLEHHDIELDVRERAKTAVWQMKPGY